MNRKNMKFIHLFCLSFLLVSTQRAPGQNYKTGADLIAAMHRKYYHGPCRAYTFSQKNTHYKNDTVSGHSEWHEAVEFPDKFRIHFGDKGKGNYVVFRNDSVFNYKGGKQVKVATDSNTLLLLLGGMYYRELPDVMARIGKAGYNVQTLSSQEWTGEEVYVIGANAGDLQANQLWVSKKNLRVLRILEKLGKDEMMDMRFEAHQDWCKGYVETKVSFRRNGKLEQAEEYYDIRAAKGFND